MNYHKHYKQSFCKNNEEAKLKQQQKNLMAIIPTFDGKDKKACLMWVNHVENTAKQARMTFREAVTSKAGPTVVTAISRYLNASDAQLKRIILESFSNVGTRNEVSHYLKMMRLDNNDTLTAHNAEYEAVHTVAYGISAVEQNDEQISEPMPTCSVTTQQQNSTEKSSGQDPT